LGERDQRVWRRDSDSLLSSYRAHFDMGQVPNFGVERVCTDIGVAHPHLHDDIRFFETSVQGAIATQGMISIRNVSRDWGDEFSLKNINLEVEEGEYFVLLGPTAAGKTLLLELVAGFYRPDHGEIWIGGVEATELPPEKRGVGFVYQDYALFPHLNVRKNVEFGLRLQGHFDPKNKAESLIETFGVGYLMERKPDTLSGGEQQRVAIARALAIDPRVLLLDEPLSALDQRTQERTRKDLKKIQQELGYTTLHVTHNQPEAIILADRIGVMMEGKLVQVGTSKEVFAHPVTREVAEFLGAENVLFGRIVSSEGGIAVVDLGEIEIEARSDLEEGSVEVFIRPEDVILSRERISTSARNLLESEVVEVSCEGVLAKVFLENGIKALVTRRSLEEMEIGPESRVFATFKASAPHVIPADGDGT